MIPAPSKFPVKSVPPLASFMTTLIVPELPTVLPVTSPNSLTTSSPKASTLPFPLGSPCAVTEIVPEFVTWLLETPWLADMRMPWTTLVASSADEVAWALMVPALLTVLPVICPWSLAIEMPWAARLADAESASAPAVIVAPLAFVTVLPDMSSLA